MKCIIFESTVSSSLEDSINEWLSSNKDKFIYDIKYNSANKASYLISYSCLIFYKELKEVRKDKLNNIDQL